MLQTRSGKRTAKAALKIAVEMAAEGLISEEEAVLRIDPSALDPLLHPTPDPAAPRQARAQVRGRDGCRRADFRGGSGAAHRPFRARSIASPDARSGGAAPRHR